MKWISVLGGLGLGLVTGVLSGLLGVGGGILMVPAMIYFWQFEPKLAVGTSLAVMIPTSLVGALRHHYSYGNVDWALAAVLAVGAVVGTGLLGAPLAELLPGDVLKKVFGIALLLVALNMLGVFEWIAALRG